MLGGMLTVFFLKTGLPMPLALVLAIAIPAVVGILLEKLAIEPAKGAEVVTLIIITIGASLVMRGLIQIWLGKGAHAFPAFSGDAPIALSAAPRWLPQSLWVLGVTAAVVAALWLVLQPHARRQGHARHFGRSGWPRELVGINTQWVLLVSFALSAAHRRHWRHPADAHHADLVRRGDHAGPQGLCRRRGRRPGQWARRRRRRPDGGNYRGDGRRLHLVGLQGRRAFPVDSRRSVFPAARPVRRQITERV